MWGGAQSARRAGCASGDDGKGSGQEDSVANAGDESGTTGNRLRQEGVRAISDGSASGEREDVERGPGRAAGQNAGRGKEGDVDGQHDGDSAPVQGRRIDQHAEAEDEGEDSQEPR